MKKLFIIIFSILIMFILWRIVIKNKNISSKTNNNDLIPVEVSKVKRVDLWDTIEITGDVRGYLEAKVFSKVPGKLNNRTKNIGDKVKKGESIATIDRDEPALEYSLADVESPIDGIITQYFVNEGESISPQVPIAEVASVEKIKILVEIPEKELFKIKTGLRALFSIDSLPGNTFEGTIINISQALNPITRTSTAEILAQNPNEIIRPGMFARVQILIKKHPKTIVIPRIAIILNPSGENTVFVIQDGIAKQRNIKIGLIKSDIVEVLSGLNEGEDVVTLGQYNLSDGTKVNICVQDKCDFTNN